MRYLFNKLWQDFTGHVLNNTPALYAMFWLSFIQWINLLTITIIINNYYSFAYFTFRTSKIVLVNSITLLFLISCNYFLLFKQRERLKEKFKNENRNMKVLGKVLLYMYMIGSFILIYIVSKAYPVIL